MKRILFTLVAIACVTSVAIAKTVPQSVVTQIRRDAEARYPNDYEMQEFKIRQQTEAYWNVKSMTAPDLPQSVFSQIRSNAESRYPSDYEMQEFKIKEQARAYKTVQSFAAPDIPQDVLMKIKRNAKEKYPTNYEMQEFKLQQQVKAYRRTHDNSADRPRARGQWTKTEKSTSRNPSSQDIPANILQKIKDRHAAEYADNYYLQKILVDADVKAYKELQSYSDPDVPGETMQRIIQNHARDYPDNYYLQQILVDADVKAYKELH